MCPALPLLRQELFNSERMPKKINQPQQNTIEDVLDLKKGKRLPAKEGMAPVHYVVRRKLK